MEGEVNQNIGSCILCKAIPLNDEEGGENKLNECASAEEDVNFVFRILLEIPPKPGISLVVDGNLINADHLLLLKSNLVGWCDQCSIDIKQARQLYQQIREATEKFRKIQRKIVETLQKCIEDDELVYDKEENYKAIWRKLCLHNEGRFNKFEYPFTVQDWATLDPPLVVTAEKKDTQNQTQLSSCRGDDNLNKNELVFKDEEDNDQQDEGQRILLIFPKSSSPNNHDDERDSLSSGITSPQHLSSSYLDNVDDEEDEEDIIESSINSSNFRGDGVGEDEDPLAENFKEEPTSDLEMDNSQDKQKDEEKSLNFCAVCKTSFKTKASLAIHQKRYHSGSNKLKTKPVRPISTTPAAMPPNYGCLDPQCNKYFKTSVYLRDHLKKHHPHIPLPSFKTASIFHKTHPELYSKIVKNPTTNSFQCPYSDDHQPKCLKSFKMKKALEHHIRSKHLGDPGTYPCTWGHNCTRTFSVWKNYQSHMDRHKETPRWKCDNCNKQFYSKNLLISHKQREHEDGNKRKPFTCEICGSSYSCRDYLYIHKSNTGCKPGKPAKKIRVKNNPGNGNGPGVCEICGKFMKNLKQHLDNGHNTDRKYMCHLCPQSFKTRGHLKLHLKRHEDKSKEGRDEVAWVAKNKFQCSVKGCRQRFPRTELLESHMKNRHGEDGDKEPEFKCQYCGKGFYLRKNLKHHEETHENEGKDPYECKICGKGFRTMIYLRYHQKHTHKMKLDDKRKVSKRR